jgi:hypothetical protein
MEGLMTAVNRRSALAAVAAVPLAAAISAPALAIGTEAPSLAELIERHRAALRRLTAATKRAGHKEPAPAEAAAIADAYDVEEDARIQLVLRAPANADEAALKARYLSRSEPFRFEWHEEDPSFTRKIIDMFSRVPT